MNFVLIGAGGHARVVADIIALSGGQVVAYSDTMQAEWLSAKRYESDAEAADSHPDAALALGFGGVSPATLARRRATLNADWADKRMWPNLVHPDASVARTSELGRAVQIMAGARIQPGAKIGDGAIVNTGAIVEHETTVGDGCHIAPGAIILGDCIIGEATMIGAGAVVLPGTSIASAFLLPALTRYPI
ncbi:acetyltransferase [Tardiphaga alba]|uniref:Acetyltransferase n=1 Tax=Tardiphaga alba TaxID=340268 RepID=A0ABX8A8Y0_9BRAD|nr:acetyltransferase [Tardiphaga alba]QUS39124.1 acetyltransferase [Tardiphaga alba]